MAEQQQSLRLFHASDSYCGVMVRGNIALSTGKSAEAIEHYTEVLYKLSPGHVCAFLNRSLAYLEEGYYELAVMDAHLAKIAADELRKVRVSGRDFSLNHDDLSAPLSLSNSSCFCHQTKNLPTFDLQTCFKSFLDLSKSQLTFQPPLD